MTSLRSNPMDTSIVLATCSRAALLRGVLASLQAQDWIAENEVELVVVDDGSTDETPAVLEAFAAAAGFPVRVLQGPRAGIAAARNLGFGAARGTWIASFDDDQLARPDWLRQLRERANTEGCACVGGALELALPEGVALAQFGPRARGVLGEQMPAAMPMRLNGTVLPATNNALLRRDVFLAVGPFDTRFTEGGEDKDLFRRVREAGHTLWFEPAALAQHITPTRRLQPGNLRWTAYRLGASDARLALGRSQARAWWLVFKRVTTSLLRDSSQILWSAIRRDRRTRLEALCSFWYGEGVWRALPELRSAAGTGPFLRSLDFRQRNGERAERTKRT